MERIKEEQSAPETTTEKKPILTREKLERWLRHVEEFILAFRSLLELIDTCREAIRRDKTPVQSESSETRVTDRKRDPVRLIEKWTPVGESCFRFIRRATSLYRRLTQR